jgi:cell division protein FtsQ
MKKFWIKVKPILIAAFWTLCLSGIVVLMGASIDHQQHLSFQSIIVNVDESNGMLFLSKDDIVNLLHDDQINIDQSKPINKINYSRLERAIRNNPYVENAELFVDANSNIRINVTQRTPILRVINNAGVSYYIDEHARKMPLSSKFTARVPVATGNIQVAVENENKTDSLTEGKLFVLARYINSDSFLTSLTEQIVVNSQKEFELIPRIADHSILLGDTDRMDEKFSKLKIFYRDGLNHVGWSDYSVVNLKYENEVYCTKRSGNATVFRKSDSTRVNGQ